MFKPIITGITGILLVIFFYTLHHPWLSGPGMLWSGIWTAGSVVTIVGKVVKKNKGTG